MEVRTVPEDQLRRVHVNDFLASVTDNTIGLAPIYGPNVVLSTLAIASPTKALVIKLNKPSRNRNATSSGRQLLQDHILGDELLSKYAFSMDKLVYTLYHCFRLRLSSARGLLPARASGPFVPANLDDALKGVPGGFKTSDLTELFKDEEGRLTNHNDNVRQAWVAQLAGASPTRLSKLVLQYDSSDHDELHLESAAKLYCLAIQLRELKPTVTKNEISKEFKLGKKGTLDVTSTRFKTRITKASHQQELQVQVRHNGKLINIDAKTKKVEGRGALIGTKQDIDFAGGATIVSVRTIGREPPTSAEQVRHQLLANILKGTATILDDRFVQTIFFPERLAPWPATTSRAPRRVVLADRTILNASQGRAVEAIISHENKHRVVLVHGPPGTGKTTVIAAAANSIVCSDSRATVWLVAHSNVAVKNIAEKLVQSEFLDFKIVVSKEFHFDWHEHLYQKVERNLIRTDSLPKDPVAAERLLLGSRVILSTLSNLMNGNMADIARVAPVQTLIVDEASQIDVGDYLPIINRYQKVLEKVVFIGDDKQLAPYGYEQIKELESIFEKKHLRGGAILLDTQYRMPLAIGSFISKNVYSNRLQTIHTIKSASACRFVHVSNSREENKGHSWVNYPEAQVVIAVARQLWEQGKAFRIITPYDPQRSHLENMLKLEKLPHEDKVFNVDSFQGNEADYIIVSLVRAGTKLGFLQENRRVNVMLTRCKKGMVIVSNRPFVEGPAKKSLVGKLAESLKGQGDCWIESRSVVQGTESVF